MNINKMSTGKRIRKLREDSGITQEDLAKYINSTKQTIYKYENDIITNIPSDKIEKLAEALGTDPSFLMGWTSSIKFDSGYEVYLTTEESEYLSLYNKINKSTPEMIEQHLKKFKKEYKNFRLKFKNINIKSLNAFLEFVEGNFSIIYLSNLRDLDSIKELYEDVMNYTEFSLKKITGKNSPPTHLTLNAAHEIEDSTEEDRQHDDDIMDDDNF